MVLSAVSPRPHRPHPRPGTRLSSARTAAGGAEQPAEHDQVRVARHWRRPRRSWREAEGGNHAAAAHELHHVRRSARAAPRWRTWSCAVDEVPLGPRERAESILAALCASGLRGSRHTSGIVFLVSEMGGHLPCSAASMTVLVSWLAAPRPAACPSSLPYPAMLRSSPHPSQPHRPACGPETVTGTAPRPIVVLASYRVRRTAKVQPGECEAAA